MNKTERKAMILNRLQAIADKAAVKGNIKVEMDCLKMIASLEGLENSNYDGVVTLRLNAMPGVSVAASGLGKDE